MPLCLFRTTDAAGPRLGLIVGERVIGVGGAGGPQSLADAMTIPAADLQSQLEAVTANGGEGIPLTAVTLAAPIDRQEVWAAGVTYLRSRDARMEESVSAKSAYDLVYEADRPEIFFKATPSRVTGPGEEIAIRGDSTWDVPEPELALAINRDGEVIGYSIGNDMSSRSIEGENPLYLPQAKMYSRCAGLGPVITLAWEMGDIRDRAIRLVIRRGGEVLFDGEHLDVADSPHVRRSGQLSAPLQRVSARRFPDDRHRHHPAVGVHARTWRRRRDQHRQHRVAAPARGPAVVARVRPSILAA